LGLKITGNPFYFGGAGGNTYIRIDQGKRVNSPYRPCTEGNTSDVILTQSTQFFGWYSHVVWICRIFVEINLQTIAIYSVLMWVASAEQALETMNAFGIFPGLALIVEKTKAF